MHEPLRRSRLQALLWLGLAIIGQAAALHLMQAGPRVAYQHYPAWRSIVSNADGFTAILLAQAVLVAWGMRRHWPNVLAVVRSWSWWRIGLAVALLFLSSAALSRDPARYVGELILATAIETVAIANFLLFAVAVPQATIDEIERRLAAAFSDSSSTPRIDRFAVIAGVGVVLLSALLAFFSYQRHPHVPDEVIYILHARYFAKGMLWLPAPPVPQGFDIDLMYYEPSRWFSPVPPGWPAMLSIGALLGVPWLVNPVLAGVNVLLAYRLVWEVYDRRTARLTTVLLALSPWHVFMAMNFMTHTFTLSCALIAANAVAMLRRSGHLRWAWLGGLGIGLVSLNRPLEGLAVALLLGLWSLGSHRKRFSIAAPLLLAVATILVGILTLPYNKLLTGHATKFPIMMYTDRYYGAGTNALGFGANRGLGWPGLDPFPGHGLMDVLVNAGLNISAINVELLGWSTGSLVLLVLFVVSGKMRRADWWMFATIVTIAGVHSFYWFSGGPDFGARYWYLVLLPCLVLTARGARLLADRIATAGMNGRAETRVLATVFALCLAALVTFFPWRSIDKYHYYRGMRPDIRALMKERDFGKSLVLIRGKRHPDYASAAVYNPLDLRANAPVFAWDRDASVRQQLLNAYPDRAVWIIDGPTQTGDGYRVVAGPLNSAQLRSHSLIAP